MPWPINVKDEEKDPYSIALAQAEDDDFIGERTYKHEEFNIMGGHVEWGQMSRDMTLFVDDDGSAYHIYSAEHNSTLHIARLTDDFTNHTGEFVRRFENRFMEAPAVF